MPDPVTAIGAVAGVAQLVDIVWKLSRELYGFFCAVGDASVDIERLQTTLKELETMLEPLKQNIAISETVATTPEESIDPSTNPESISKRVSSPEIVTVLKSLEKELGLLRETLPQQPKINVKQKLKWVFERKKTMAILERLDRDKSILHLAIEIIIMRNSLTQSTRIREIRNGLASMQEMPSLQKQMSDQLEKLTTDFSKLQTSTALVEPDPDLFSRVLRVELQSILIPALNQCLNEHDSRHEAHFQKLQSMIDDIALRFSKVAASAAAPHEQSLSQGCRSTYGITQGDGCFKLERSSGDGSFQDIDLPKGSYQGPSLPGSSPQHFSKCIEPIAIYEYNWILPCAIGLLSITFKIIQPRPNNTFPRFQLTISFLPSSILSFLPGLSFLYTTGPDKRGYSQIFPTISICRIIRKSSPLWKCWRSRDYEGLRKLYSNGVLRPYDRHELGMTPLHLAAGVGNDVLCKILLREGLDPFSECPYVLPTGSSEDNKLMIATSDSRAGRTPIEHLYLFGLRFALKVRVKRGESLRSCLRRLQRTCLVLEEAGTSSAVFFQCYTALDSLGLYTRWWDTWDEGVDSLSPSAMETIRSWVDFLRPRQFDPNRTIDGISSVDRALLFAIPSPTTVGQLSILLNCGADVTSTNDRGYQPLHMIFLVGVPGIPEEETSAYYDSVSPDWREFLTRSLVCLIRAGADIYALTPKGDSLFILACRRDCLGEYCNALWTCGLDPLEVLKTDWANRRAFKANRDRLHGAKRTAVDAEFLELPSADGLSERKKRVHESDD